MASAEQSLLAELESIGPQILGTKQAASAFFTILIYDHVLTLPDEIEYIWKRKFTLVSFLFFMNRYYALVVLSIFYTAMISPIFTPEICSHFSLFLPLAGGIVLTMLPNVVLALRVCALYERNKIISIVLAVYLLAELSVAIWIYATPGAFALPIPAPVQNNIVFHICIEEIANSLGNVRASAFQLMQAVYDTSVFSLILYKALSDKRSRRTQSILAVIAFHGVIYYAALFSANISWALMILFAPPGIRYTPSFPTFVLACTLVNRITLSLRRFSSLPWGASSFAGGMPWLSNTTIFSSTIRGMPKDQEHGTDTIYTLNGEGMELEERGGMEGNLGDSVHINV